MEPCERCVGEARDGEPVLRALGRVLGDLATLGYDAQWKTIRVSDIGGAHHRARVFVLAHRRDTYTWSPRWGEGRVRPDQENQVSAQHGDLVERPASGDTSQPVEEISLFLPTPVASPSGNSPEEHLRKKPGRTQVTDLSIIATHNLFPTGGKALPTPKASDGDFGTPRTSGRPAEKAQHLATRAVHDMPGTLLPTPNTMDSLDWREGEARDRALRRGRADRNPSPRTGNLREEVHFNFGEYTPAIRRWESIIGRQAPPAAVPSKTGRPQLNPRFSEWLMGLPDGWVTDPELGLTRAQQLKAIGNGVCPQQALVALSEMLENIEPITD